MAEKLDQIMLHPAWPSGHGPIWPVTSRLNLLFTKFQSNHFLLLHGKPESGKKTIAVSLIKKWIEQVDRDHHLQRNYIYDCSDGEGLYNHPDLTVEKVRERNDKASGGLYCFLECQRVLDPLTNLFKELIDKQLNLKHVSVLLTASIPEGLKPPDRGLFDFAERNLWTEYWDPDKSDVEEVLTSAGRKDRYLDSLFAEAFQSPTGSVDMALVREFIEAEPLSLNDWLQERREIAPDPIGKVFLPQAIYASETPAVAAERTASATGVDEVKESKNEAVVERTASTPVMDEVKESEKEAAEPEPSQLQEPAALSLAAELKNLVESEVEFVNQACKNRSKKTLPELFVSRAFRGVSLPGEFAPTHEKYWAELTANPAGLVLLGNAGFGKTLQLLNHELSACNKVLAQLKFNSLLGPPADEIALTLYTRAPELAEELTKGKISLLEAATHHLERVGRTSSTITPWVLSMLKQGRGTLIVDSMDEVSETPPNPSTESPRLVVMEALKTHLYDRSACRVIVGARKLGYDLDEPLPLPHWELLPFTKGQLKAAITKWFPLPEWQEKFCHVLRGAQPFEDMVLIPVLLMLAAQMYQESFQAGEGAPRLARRVDFYLRASYRYRRDWIKRMTEAGNPPTRAQQDQFLPFLDEVSWILWSESPNRSEFSGHELVQAIAKSDIPAALKALDCYEIVRESGLLTGFEGTGTSYEFLHRTLLEFLAASHLVRKAQERGSTRDVWEEIQKQPNVADSSVPWMAAGLLEEPGALIDSLLRWASDGPLKIASNSSRIELTEPLVDCLYECQSGKVSPASLNLAWQLFARTLDTIQRQRGRDNDEWRQLVDWSLTYRILHAAKIHEGVQAQTVPLEAVLEKLRHTEGGNMVEDPAQVVESIRTSMTSGCAPVRWASIWAIGALKEKKWKMNESKLRELLKPLLDFIETAFHSDLDIHVRAIAGRALVKTKHPDAFQMLVKRLNECDAEDTAGAAIAISGFGTEEAVIALKGRAERALSESPGDARNIILGAVIGSLDAVVKKMKETADRFALRDTLMRALESPSIVARASAASALGNLHVLEAWPVLARILEAPRIAETEALRGPSSWAAQQLAPLLNEPIERARATRIFRGILADRSELPNVRKPAASALGTFFKKERPEIPVLQLLQREAQDPAVATACLIALCRARTTEAYPYLILLLKQDIDIRSQFCDAAANQPSALALNAVLWLLDNDKRPEIQKGAFNAISKAAEQAKDRAVLEAENYGTDTKLLFLLAKMCVTNIRSKHAESVQSSMFALWGLAKLPTFKSGGAISLLLKSSLTSVRELAESSSPSMQESAAFLLGAIGERSDIALIRRLGIETKDRRLQGAFHSSAHFLSRRLDNEAHRGNLS